MEDKDARPARPGSPEYYRERARTMLKLADEAASSEARASLIMDTRHRIAVKRNPGTPAKPEL